MGCPNQMLSFSEAYGIAQAQGKLWITEQGIIYGNLTLQQITRDMELCEQTYETSEKKDFDSASREMKLNILIAERISIAEEIHCLKESSKQSLNYLNGAGKISMVPPDFHQTVLGQRLAHLNYLPENSPFAKKTILMHHFKFLEFSLSAEKAKQLGDATKYASLLACANFYSKARLLLVNKEKGLGTVSGSDLGIDDNDLALKQE